MCIVTEKGKQRMEELGGRDTRIEETSLSNRKDLNMRMFKPLNVASSVPA